MRIYGLVSENSLVGVGSYFFLALGSRSSFCQGGAGRSAFPVRQLRCYTGFTNSHKYPSTTSIFLVIQTQGQKHSLPLPPRLYPELQLRGTTLMPLGNIYWFTDYWLTWAWVPWIDYRGKRIKFTLTPRHIRFTQGYHNRDYLKPFNLCTTCEKVICDVTNDAIFFTFLKGWNSNFYTGLSPEIT